MENIEKMRRYYTAMLRSICGDDYEKVQAASQTALIEHEEFCDDIFGFCESLPTIEK